MGCVIVQQQFRRPFCVLLILVHLSVQQSAELEDLQRLCPDLKGVFCSHCDHKSVEQICPVECNVCSSFRTNGVPRFLGSSAQNLIELKRQCASIRSVFCYACKITSINELCVEECLDCEERPAEDERGIMELLGGTRQQSNDRLGVGRDDGASSVDERGELIETEVGLREGSTANDALARPLF